MTTTGFYQFYKSKRAKDPRDDVSRKTVGIDRVISHVCVVKVFRGCLFNGVSLKKKSFGTAS